MKNEQEIKEKLENFFKENEEKVKSQLLFFYSALLSRNDKDTYAEVLAKKLLNNFDEELSFATASSVEKQQLCSILKTSLLNSVTKFSDSDFQEHLKIFLQGYVKLSDLSLTQALKAYMNIIQNELQIKNKKSNNNILTTLSNANALTNNQADTYLIENYASNTTKKPMKGARILRDKENWKLLISWASKEDKKRVDELRQRQQIDASKSKKIQQNTRDVGTGAIYGILIFLVLAPTFLYLWHGPLEDKVVSKDEIDSYRKKFFLAVIIIMLTTTGGFFGTAHVLDHWRKYKRHQQEKHNNAQKILHMKNMLKKLIQIEIVSSNSEELATEDLKSETTTNINNVNDQTIKNTNIYIQLKFLSLYQIQGETLPSRKIKHQKQELQKNNFSFWKNASKAEEVLSSDHQLFDGLIDINTINIPGLRGIPNCYILVAETVVRKQAEKTKIEDKALDALIALGTTNPHTAAKGKDAGVVDISPGIPGNLYVDDEEKTGCYSKKLKNSLVAGGYEIYCFETLSDTKATFYIACYLADYHDRNYPKFIMGPKISSADLKSPSPKIEL